MKFGIYFIISALVFNIARGLSLRKDLPEKNSTTGSNSDNSTRSSIEVVVDSDISTLVEVPVTYTTGISYYYPYFYKTHLISFVEDSNSFFTQNATINNTNNICGQNCDLCADKVGTNSTTCLRCAPGFFLDGDKCVDFCPDGKVADILRAKCMSSDSSQNVDVVYSMAYSLGSCSNMCGKMVQDCSCAPSCKSRGNCCTDYDVVNCDLIMEKALKVNKSKCEKDGCELCETTSNATQKEQSFKCNQCNDTTDFFEGTCVQSCPEGYSLNKVNRICFQDQNKCSKNFENCDQCESDADNNQHCVKCQRGKFLYDNKCVEKCPSGFRADRITWTCLEPPVFGWYWVYPTRNSCRNKCDAVIADSDCSCASDCVFEGSCCPDYDMECGNILLFRKGSKNNSKNKKSNINKKKLAKK